MSGKETKDGMDAHPIFVKYVGRFAVQLEAFGNHELLPGDIEPVRGPMGVPYATARNLVREQKFIWSDENGVQLDYEPEPKPGEEEALKRINPQNPAGDPNRVYPAYDHVDSEYQGPVVGEVNRLHAAEPVLSQPGVQSLGAEETLVTQSDAAAKSGDAPEKKLSKAAAKEDAERVHKEQESAGSAESAE